MSYNWNQIKHSSLTCGTLTFEVPHFTKLLCNVAKEYLTLNAFHSTIELPLQENCTWFNAWIPNIKLWGVLKPFDIIEWQKSKTNPWI